MSKKLIPFQALSLKSYIIDRARKLPFYKCWSIGDDFSGVKQIIVSRQKAGGKLVVGFYLVDFFCLGLKDTFYREFDDEEEFEEVVFDAIPDEITPQEIDPIYAQNVIYGGVEYAEDLGFSPAKDFKVTEYILDDVEELEYIEIEFGKNGKPFYITGDEANVAQNLKILEENVGRGNYSFMNTTDNKRFDEYETDDDDYEDSEEDIELEELRALVGDDLISKIEQTISEIDDEGVRSFFLLHLNLLMKIDKMEEDSQEGLLEQYQTDKGILIEALRNQIIEEKPDLKETFESENFTHTILVLIEQYIDYENFHFSLLKSYRKALESLIEDESTPEQFRFLTSFEEKRTFFAIGMIQLITGHLYNDKDFVSINDKQKQAVIAFFLNEIQKEEASDISDIYEDLCDDFFYYNSYLNWQDSDIKPILEEIRNLNIT